MAKKWKCKVHSGSHQDATIGDLLAANGEMKREVDRLKKENDELKRERQHYFNRAVNLQLENCQLERALNAAIKPQKAGEKAPGKEYGRYFYERTTVEVKK